MPVTTNLTHHSLRTFLRLLPSAAALLAALLLLSACPRRTADGQDAGDTGAVAQAPQGAMKGGLSPSTTTPPESDAAGDASGGDGAVTQGGGSAAPTDDAQQVAAAPARSELAGRWFALYGREGAGMAYYTYMDARFITLDEQGNILVEDGAAAPNAALRGRYELADGRLRVRFADPRLGAEQLLAGGTALDRAAGSRPAGGFILAGSKAVTAESMGLKLEYDEQFMALADGRGKLTVYGRDENPHLGGIPGLPGQWQLYLGPRGSYVCELSVDGVELDLVWREGGGWFKGRFSHGYYVGQGQDAAVVFAGALTLSGEGTLNGYYSPQNFTEAMPIFDLKRIATQ